MRGNRFYIASAFALVLALFVTTADGQGLTILNRKLATFPKSVLVGKESFAQMAGLPNTAIAVFYAPCSSGVSIGTWGSEILFSSDFQKFNMYVTQSDASGKFNLQPAPGTNCFRLFFAGVDGQQKIKVSDVVQTKAIDPKYKSHIDLPGKYGGSITNPVISSDGQYVLAREEVNVTVSNPSYFYEKYYLAYKGSSVKELPMPIGVQIEGLDYTPSYYSGINSLGQVVGGRETTAPNFLGRKEYEPVVWDYNSGNSTALSFPSNWDSAEGWHINDRGDVFGQFEEHFNYIYGYGFWNLSNPSQYNSVNLNNGAAAMNQKGDVVLFHKIGQPFEVYEGNQLYSYDLPEGYEDPTQFPQGINNNANFLVDLRTVVNGPTHTGIARRFSYDKTRIDYTIVEPKGAHVSLVPKAFNDREIAVGYARIAYQDEDPVLIVGQDYLDITSLLPNSLTSNYDCSRITSISEVTSQNTVFVTAKCVRLSDQLYRAVKIELNL